MIQTAGRWSWKSKPAKERVTTHLPNQLAPKMDGAEARDLYSAAGASASLPCVGGRGRRCEAYGVSRGESASSADLGGSSKYSNENFEGRSGERFHVNSNWTWVSRS